MRSRYFEQQNYRATQRVVEDLVTEAIKIHGVDAYYLPKTFVNKDKLFGEDASRKFLTAATIELYVKDAAGWSGEGDILSKFGMDIRDNMTFTMSRRRFEQIRTEKFILSNGWNLKLNPSSKSQPYYNTANNFCLRLNSATGNGYSIPTPRPMEGDLIYFKNANTLFEIKFVEHEQPFYQFGALYTYDVQCERFEYSSEVIDTGYAEIDIAEDKYSFAVNDNELMLNSGDRFVFNDGGSLVLSDYRLADQDPIANNEFFATQATGGLIDWSEDDPFSELN